MRQRKRLRMLGYDYSKDNLYFVTSCIKNMKCYFGTVKMGEMKLNEYGKIAEAQWYWLEIQYPYVVLHAFVVMPNHIHGIIEINRNLAPESPKIKSLSELMGAYKTTVSKQIHLLGFNDFVWHRSFHESIVRDDKAYKKIIAYIENNPMKWSEDEFFL